MIFGYLGKDKLDVDSEWKDTDLPEDLGKYVVAQFFRGNTLNFCIGTLERHMFCATLSIRKYKVISKETYDLLTS
jgi:hypothetical protein